MFDDDELLQQWVELVMAHGSDHAAMTAMDMDAQWADVDPGEMSDLLSEFADDHGHDAMVQLTFLLVTGDL